jgi:hypothetical protein
MAGKVIAPGDHRSTFEGAIITALLFQGSHFGAGSRPDGFRECFVAGEYKVRS